MRRSGALCYPGKGKKGWQVVERKSLQSKGKKALEDTAAHRSPRTLAEQHPTAGLTLRLGGSELSVAAVKAKAEHFYGWARDEYTYKLATRATMALILGLFYQLFYLNADYAVLQKKEEFASILAGRTANDESDSRRRREGVQQLLSGFAASHGIIADPTTGRKRWQQAPTDEELEVLKALVQEELRPPVASASMFWARHLRDAAAAEALEAEAHDRVRGLTSQKHVTSRVVIEDKLDQEHSSVFPSNVQAIPMDEEFKRKIAAQAEKMQNVCVSDATRALFKYKRSKTRDSTHTHTHSHTDPAEPEGHVGCVDDAEGSTAPTLFCKGRSCVGIVLDSRALRLSPPPPLTLSLTSAEKKEHTQKKTISYQFPKSVYSSEQPYSSQRRCRQISHTERISPPPLPPPITHLAHTTRLRHSPSPPHLLRHTD